MLSVFFSRGRRGWAWFFALIALVTARAEPPRLDYVRSDGSAYDRFRTDEMGIVAVTADGTVPIPLDGGWALRGSILESAGTAWFPPFAVRATPRQQASQSQGCEVLITLSPGAPYFWPLAELRGSIAVFVWAVEGKVTQVNPVPLRAAHLREGEIAARARFRLSAGESRGMPAVLLLRDNRWIPPAASPLPGELLRAIVQQAGSAAVPIEVHLGKLESRQRFALFQALVVGRVGDALKPLLRESRGGLSPTDWTSLLEVAVRSGSTESLRLLLGAGGKIPPNTLTSLLETAINNRQEASALALNAHAEREGVRLRRREQMMALAIEEGLEELLLAQAGAALPAVVKNVDRGRFERVVRQGHARMVRRLLENGIEPARVDPDATALAFAVAINERALVALYLRAGGKPDPASASVDAPLVHALKAGAREIAADLLAAGADPNRAKTGGVNALSAAVLSVADGMVPWALGHAGSKFSPDSLRAALELSLRLRQRVAVAELAKAGAQLPFAAVRPLVEDILAVDAAELWEMFLSQGGRVDEALAGTWTALDIAIAYDAKECLRRMEQRGRAVKNWTHAPPKVRPSPVDLVVPVSIRSLERDWPALTVEVSGVVDETGSFRCINVSGSDDAALGFRLRQAAAKFRFTPARGDGEPVRARIMIPLNLEAAAQRVYRVVELDLPPVALSSNGRLETYHGPVSIGAQWQSYGTPGGAGLINEIASVLYALGTTGIEMTNNPVRDADGSIMPMVSFIIARDGTVRDATIVWASDRFDGEGALRRAARMRFLPGITRGRAVEVPMTSRVSAR